MEKSIFGKTLSRLNIIFLHATETFLRFSFLFAFFGPPLTQDTELEFNSMYTQLTQTMTNILDLKFTPLASKIEMKINSVKQAQKLRERIGRIRIQKYKYSLNNYGGFSSSFKF
jgi:hypothetical protein